MSIPFLHPASIMITGPSGSGKTVFIRRLITENMIYPNPERIVIVYGEWQKIYDELLKVVPTLEFIKGPSPPSLYESFDVKENNLLVLDDQMTEWENTLQIEKYFVQGSHHRNLTVVFIVQNLFGKNKALRTSSLNSNYLILYKNPRDKQQMGILGRQMYPHAWKNLLASIRNSTS